MRAKQIFSLVPVIDGARTVWHRITFSRLTILYFVFSVAHCVTQVLFQGQAFLINANASTLFATVLTTANATFPGFTFLDSSLQNGTTALYWCKGTPSGTPDKSGCRVLWGHGQYGYHMDGQSEETQHSNGNDDSTIAIPDDVSILGPATATLSSITITLPTATPGQVITLNSPSAQQTAENPIPTSNNRHQNSHQPSPNTNTDTNTNTDNNGSDSSGLNAVLSFIDPFAPVKRSPTPPHDPHYRDSPNPSGPPTEFVNIFGRTTSSNPTQLAVTTTVNGTVVEINGLPNAPPHLVLSQQCLLALNWPLETLQNTKREDIVFINFHVWVLGMSIVALLNESIPHMLASLVTHIMVTGWSAFQLLHTKNFQNDYKMIIMSLCDGQNLLPTYWKDRADAELPSAAFNGAALIVSAYLSWKLFKTYNWATFKRIGANRTISRVYKIVLSLSVTLQLSLFFLVVSMALWIDQLCNGQIGLTTTHMMLYRITYIIGLVLLVPWIVAGWKAVRRENRPLMLGFLIFNVLLIGWWASMFASITFRWTFIQWRFFSIMSVLAVFLTLVTLVLGIWCRKNFGSELWKYLHSERLADDEEFTSSSVSMYDSNSLIDEKRYSFSQSEKISFPSPGPIPTFGSAFGSNPVSRTTSNQSSSSFYPAQHVVYPMMTTPPAAANGFGGRRISVGSAHSVSTIDGSGSPPSSTRLGRSGSNGKTRGARLQKKWIIE